MVVVQEVNYDVDGLTMAAHLALPDGEGPWPAVLLGHDGVGLERYQRRRADILAERGYATLALDYHAGRTYFGEPHAMLERVMPLLSDPARMREIGRAGLDALLAVPGVDASRLAALGYGAGGSIVLELARTGTPFAAVAAVHPAVTAARATDWTDVGATFLLCTGSEDPLCTPEQLMSFTSVLQEAGVEWSVTVYGGAQHAFWADPMSSGEPLATVPGVGHHAAHARRAWRAVLNLLDEALADPTAVRLAPD